MELKDTTSNGYKHGPLVSEGSVSIPVSPLLPQDPVFAYNSANCHVDKTSNEAFGMEGLLLMRIFKLNTKMTY